MKGDEEGTVQEFYGRGIALVEAREFEKAVPWLVRALLDAPAHRPRLLALGEALAQLGRWEDARRVYEELLRRYPHDAEAALRLERLSEQSAAGVASGDSESAAAGSAADRRDERSGRGHQRKSFIAPQITGTESETMLFQRAQLLGGIAFVAVLATYVLVGLATHFVIGLAAAGSVALSLAALGSLFFSPHRRLGFKGMLRGMLLGTGVVLLAGAVSIIVALAGAVSGG